VFERFTDAARRVVVLAQEEARGLEHPYIGTEHLLLGLLAEDRSIAARTLAALDVRLEAARHEVEMIIGPGARAPAAPHIPFTPRAKKVLELSLREAIQLGHNFIGPEHILLGLIREGEGVGVQVLERMGAHPASVRAETIGLMRQLQSERASASVAADVAVRLRPMTEDEFDGYVAHLAEEGADRPVPGSVATPGEVLVVAEDPETGEGVGVLWFGPAGNDSTTAWVHDLEVDEAHRREGYGRAILRSFEDEAAERGFTSCGSDVRADDHVARHLFLSLGYEETSVRMRKGLERPG
jgi:GNAT superfamily N-acetyltransferase